MDVMSSIPRTEAEFEVLAENIVGNLFRAYMKRPELHYYPVLIWCAKQENELNEVSMSKFKVQKGLWESVDGLEYYKEFADQMVASIEAADEDACFIKLHKKSKNSNTVPFSMLNQIKDGIFPKKSVLKARRATVAPGELSGSQQEHPESAISSASAVASAKMRRSKSIGARKSGASKARRTSAPSKGGRRDSEAAAAEAAAAAAAAATAAAAAAAAASGVFSAGLSTSLGSSHGGGGGQSAKVQDFMLTEGELGDVAEDDWDLGDVDWGANADDNNNNPNHHPDGEEEGAAAATGVQEQEQEQEQGFSLGKVSGAI